MRFVILSIFVLFGLAMLYVGVTQFFMQRTLTTDPRRVTVKITRSDVTSHRSSDTDHRTLRDNSTTTYRPNVSFSYEINGKVYASELLKPTVIEQTYGSHDAAADAIRDFPVGSTVQAYYRPEYPDKAYLLRETSAGPIVFVLVGLFAPVASWLVVKFFV